MERLHVQKNFKVDLSHETNPENRKTINEFIESLWKDCNGILDKFLDKINLHNKSKEVKQNKNSEIFWICDENGNNLYYSNGMPVLEFRGNCHKKIEISNLMNYHKGTNRIITDSQGNIFLSIKNANKSDTGGGKMEIGGGHTGVNGFYETLLTELDEELSIKQGEYEDPVEINTTILSDDEQNQYNKVYNVIVNNKEFLNRKGDGETGGGKFYSVSEIIEFIKGTKIISHHRAPLLDFLAMKGYVSESEYNSLKQNIETQDISNDKYIKVIRTSSKELVKIFS